MKIILMNMSNMALLRSYNIDIHKSCKSQESNEISRAFINLRIAFPLHKVLFVTSLLVTLTTLTHFFGWLPNVSVNSKTAHAPPPGQTPGHLTFLKNFGQIPRYVARIDGQMPHPLELQRGSNPPPFRHVTHEINEFIIQISYTVRILIF